MYYIHMGSVGDPEFSYEKKEDAWKHLKKIVKEAAADRVINWWDELPTNPMTGEIYESDFYWAMDAEVKKFLSDCFFQQVDEDGNLIEDIDFEHEMHWEIMKWLEKNPYNLP